MTDITECSSRRKRRAQVSTVAEGLRGRVQVYDNTFGSGSRALRLETEVDYPL